MQANQPLEFLSREFQDQLLQALRAKKVEVTFAKATGEERIMTCTLSEEFGRPSIKLEESKKRPNPDVCAVWDCTAQAWRSFRWDRLKGVRFLDG